MKLPDTSRQVLIWARDSAGLEDWHIDCYLRPPDSNFGDWIEGAAWDMKVLFWCELRPPPSPEEMEEK